MTVISHDGPLLRTLPWPSRKATGTGCAKPDADSAHLHPLPHESSSSGRSQRGFMMVATQRIHVGMIHARKTVTVTVSDHSFHISLDSQTISVVPGDQRARGPPYKAYAPRKPR